MIRKLIHRLRTHLLRTKTEREMDAELRFHLEMETAENIRRGMSEEEAGLAARRSFGGVAQTKEAYRDVVRFRWIEDVWRDLRYGARMLIKHPGFTAIAVVTLSLGIGANTAIFSLANALFLQPPAGVEDPDQLAGVFGSREGSTRYTSISYADYVDYRDRATVFSKLASQGTVWMYLVSGGDALEVYAHAVSWNYFSVLGVKPALGRFFLQEEDAVPGQHPVAVLSHKLWQKQFRGDPAIIGKTIAMNQTAFTVVGIAPAEFRGIYAGSPEELWIPSMMASVNSNSTANAATPGDVLNRRNDWLNLIGRLKPGRTIVEAQAEMAMLARQIETAHPETNRGRGVRLSAVKGIAPMARESEVQSSLLLGAAVGCLLLIVCANLAGLLLARGASRRREIAVRLSMGAGRARIVRQLLTESLLLSFLGGVAAWMIAAWMTELISSFYTYSLSGLQIRLDLRVLVCALALSVVTGFVFGLAPALQATRFDLAPALKDEGAISGHRQSRLRAALVVTQIALSFVLLAGAGLLVQSLRNVLANPGYDLSHIAHFRLRPSRVGYDTSKAHAYYRELIRRLEALPGVQSVVLGAVAPHAAVAASVSLPGQTPARQEDVFEVHSNAITPGFLESLKIPLIEGRGFDARDRQGAPLVVVINQTLARRLWLGREPVGESIVINGEEHRVVGVAKDATPQRSNEGPTPYLYRAYWQTAGVDLRLFVRVLGDPLAAIARLRQEAVAVDPDVHIGQEMPLLERTKMSYQSERMVGSLLSFTGLLALFLSAIGLYGVLAYAVSQRTREIGIRMALGAQTGDVLKQVLGHGMKLAALGMAIGLGGALALTRLLKSLLYGVSATDPVSFAAIALLLTGAALLACYLPARRATKVDSMVALRHE